MKTEKHIKVTGYSNISWKDAIVKSIEEASKTLNNLCCVTVIEQRAKIENNKISEYLVDLDIAFQIENMSSTPVQDEQDSL